MQESSIRKRKSNIELLRIVAMFMIVASHYYVHGIKQCTLVSSLSVWREGEYFNKIVAQICAPGGEVGVAIFFIIAGYFCVMKDNCSIKKVAIQTVFYSIVTALIYAVLNLCGIELTPIITGSYKNNFIKQLCMPLSSGVYWFVTSYLVLIIISPILNKVIRGGNRKGVLIYIGGIYVLWYVCSSFISAPYYNIQRGILFYFIGAYIRLHVNLKDVKQKINVWMFIIGWFAYSILNYVATELSFISNKNSILSIVHRISSMLPQMLFVPIIAISCFIIFLKINIKNNDIINGIASTTFGVYLLHDSPLLRTVLWDKIWHVSDVQFVAKYFAIWMIITIVITFVVCSVVDIMRQKWIQPRIDNLVDIGILKWKENFMENI